MENFSSKFVFTEKGANSPSRGHLQRESPDALEKPQSAVEPYEPCQFSYIPFVFLLIFCLLDSPAVHSSTQELLAGTFTAPVTGLFVGQSPVTRGLAPCCSLFMVLSPKTLLPQTACIYCVHTHTHTLEKPQRARCKTSVRLIR